MRAQKSPGADPLEQVECGDASLQDRNPVEVVMGITAVGGDSVGDIASVQVDGLHARIPRLALVNAPYLTPAPTSVQLGRPDRPKVFAATRPSIDYDDLRVPP